MSDKSYAIAFGVVQAFSKDGVKQPAVELRTTPQGKNVYGFKIAGMLVSVAGKQAGPAYVGVSMFEEDWGQVATGITEGMFVSVDGAYNGNESKGVTYHNINANKLHVGPAVQRLERKVENAIPVAAQAAPVAAGSSIKF